MVVCSECGQRRFALTMGEDGICMQCHADMVMAGQHRERSDHFLEVQLAEQEEARLLARIIVTTETAHNLPVHERLDIITAEVVIGLHLFKDIASAFRDTFGGRSKTMQDGLREARITALTELRREALELGADAVVGVDLDFSEISGGGKSMLFLVASGTAVTLFNHAPGDV